MGEVFLCHMGTGKKLYGKKKEWIKLDKASGLWPAEKKGADEVSCDGVVMRLVRCVFFFGYNLCHLDAVF